MARSLLRGARSPVRQLVRREAEDERRQRNTPRELRITRHLRINVVETLTPNRQLEAAGKQSDLEPTTSGLVVKPGHGQISLKALHGPHSRVDTP